MNKLKSLFIAMAFTTMATLLSGTFSNAAATQTKDDLVKDSDNALHMLVTTNPTAAQLAKKAKAILIFPSIVKAGLIFGGAYGEGVLKRGSGVDGFYNSVTASFGWQAGAQSYGYVVFLMNDKTVNYVRETHGWEIGVGPTVVVVNEGVAKNISSTSMQNDAYAFIFDQQGLMASLSIEGTKISHIHNP